MINADNIFSLFSGSEEPQGNIDIYQTPIYWLGMYRKIIVNHNNFGKKFLKIWEGNKDIDLKEVADAGEYILYTRAWHYIDSIDIELEEHQLAVKYCSDMELVNIISKNIRYFEKYEEYEKCAHLQKILNFSKKILSSS
jgi:hypothetical protein